MTPTIGRVVHYRIGGTDEAPELRAAEVARTFPGYSYVNLVVTLDGTNDDEHHGIRWRGPDDGPRTTHPTGAPMFTRDECVNCRAWRTSVNEGTRIGEWRWPSRVEAAPAPSGPADPILR